MKLHNVVAFICSYGSADRLNSVLQRALICFIQTSVLWRVTVISLEVWKM